MKQGKKTEGKWREGHAGCRGKGNRGRVKGNDGNKCENEGENVKKKWGGREWEEGERKME